MLASITYATHVLAMTISLWMAFYLFARGYPNRITLRAVLALFAIAIFFLGSYNRFFLTFSNTDQLRAALLVIALGCWYSATYALLTAQKQAQFRWMEMSIYILGSASVILLATTQAWGIPNPEDLLYTTHLKSNFVNILYGITQVVASIGIIFNLVTQERVFHTTEGKYYLFASLLLILSLVYGILSMTINLPLPRVIEDGLVFGGIFTLGISVARHQSMVERRTIWQDFFIAMLGMFGIVAFYVILYFWLEIPEYLLGNIVALIIITHSFHDLGREAVERWRKREEHFFKLKSRQTKQLGDEAIRSYLNRELTLLLETLSAERGLIAMQENGRLVVAASQKSLSLDEEMPNISTMTEGLYRVENQIPGLVWLSQSFEGLESIALVGIGASLKKLEYSNGDLELLDEFTERIATLISINRSNKGGLQSATNRATDNLALPPEADWVKVVDDALRRFSDYVSLGQSPLADRFGISAESHIERGKKMQFMLREAIQSLRPEGERPPEPLPREWYNHVVLHDAYIKGVPNREVMARLYVSEGTFHRIRRHAVRGVARYLAEKKKLEN